jgi:hypothetical protein
VEATPDATGRRKVRLPLDLAPLATALSERALRLDIRLTIGGLPADARAYRLLHARAAWPGTLRALPAGLEFVPDRAEGIEAGETEQALVVVPREDEADYRRFRPPLLTSPRSTSSAEALFLGDPLVEPPAGTAANVPVGLAARLAQALPEKEWTRVLLPGPHRDLFIFRLLAAAETHLRGRPGGRISGLVLVSLGLGDAARQTPGYDFERGLDVLVDRLRRAGAERIFFLGVLPEPGRMRQAESYQAKVLDVIRQQHLEGLDLFTPWTKEQDWERRYRLESESPTPAYGPVPNAAALDEITEQLKARLK